MSHPESLVSIDVAPAIDGAGIRICAEKGRRNFDSVEAAYGWFWSECG